MLLAPTDPTTWDALPDWPTDGPVARYKPIDRLAPDGQGMTLADWARAIDACPDGDLPAMERPPEDLDSRSPSDRLVWHASRKHAKALVTLLQEQPWPDTVLYDALLAAVQGRLASETGQPGEPFDQAAHDRFMQQRDDPHDRLGQDMVLGSLLAAGAPSDSRLVRTSFYAWTRPTVGWRLLRAWPRNLPEDAFLVTFPPDTARRYSLAFELVNGSMWSEHRAMLDLLIRAGHPPDLGILDANGHGLPLFAKVLDNARERNTPSTVCQLLAHGANPNYRPLGPMADPETPPKSPLEWAVSLLYFDGFMPLIDAGGDPTRSRVPLLEQALTLREEHAQAPRAPWVRWFLAQHERHRPPLASDETFDAPVAAGPRDRERPHAPRPDLVLNARDVAHALVVLSTQVPTFDHHPPPDAGECYHLLSNWLLQNTDEMREFWATHQPPGTPDGARRRL